MTDVKVKRIDKVRKKKITIVSILCLFLSIPLILHPLATVIVYEAVFGMRYETATTCAFTAEDFPGLQMSRSDFSSEGVRLAGYKYFSNNSAPRGVVVLAHGMGGGGHASYLPFVNAFVLEGYLVFAYDACGNDNSGGSGVKGLPRGVIDLDSALCHVQGQSDYKDLPVMLFGHSWGAYSAGSVLALHPEVRAVVLVAGFNESEDLLLYQSSKIAGPLAKILLPSVSFYEQLKFGKDYADLSAVSSMAQSRAGVLVVHSTDDRSVPVKYGYDRFYAEFSQAERFRFLLLEDRGHTDLLFDEQSLVYREELREDYAAYLEKNRLSDNKTVRESYLLRYFDKKKCYLPDDGLMEQVLALYEAYS